jgi:hypothetical protein
VRAFSFFVHRHQITKKVDHIVQNSTTRFHVALFVDGLTKKEFFTQPKGLVCQNKACGSETHIFFKEKICWKCKYTGSQKNSLSGNFSFFCPVRILTFDPVMLVRIITRNWEIAVSSDIFVRLREFVINKKMQLLF